MSKLLAAFYGHRSVNSSAKPKAQEYTVLGINQPMIAPEIETEPMLALQPPASPTISDVQRKFRFSLLLNKLL